MDDWGKILVRLLQLAGHSERKAANLVGISPTSFNAWVRGRALPSDDQCATIAGLLKMDVAYLIAAVHLERASGKKETAPGVKDAWRRIAKQFGKAAAVAVVAIGTATLLPSPAADAAVRPNPCVLCKIRRFPFCRCQFTGSAA